MGSVNTKTPLTKSTNCWDQQHTKDKHGLSESFKRDYLHLYAEDESELDYVPFDITDPDYMDAYFKALHRPLEAEGVDGGWTGSRAKAVLFPVSIPCRG